MRESFPYVSQAFDKALQILPVKKNTGAALPIDICYNRIPLSEEDVDYIYLDSFNPATGKQRLWAPLAADVVLDEANSNPFYQIDITTFTLKMDSGKGFVQYITEGRKDEVISVFTKTDQGFSFDLNEEWKADVPSSRLPARDRIDLYFNVAFQRQNDTLGSLDFSSRRSETSGGNVSLGWLNLLWDCVAKGTLVRMADGSDRPIENLRVGDSTLDTLGIPHDFGAIAKRLAGVIVAIYGASSLKDLGESCEKLDDSLLIVMRAALKLACRTLWTLCRP